MLPSEAAEGAHGSRAAMWSSPIRVLRAGPRARAWQEIKWIFAVGRFVGRSRFWGLGKVTVERVEFRRKEAGFLHCFSWLRNQGQNRVPVIRLFFRLSLD